MDTDDRLREQENIRSLIEKEFNTQIERIFNVALDEGAVRVRLIAHLEQIGYRLLDTGNELIFKRGSSKNPDAALAPTLTESVANIKIRRELTGVKVIVFFRFNTILHFPWEKQYWLNEMADLEKALNSSQALPKRQFASILIIIALNALLGAIVVGIPTIILFLITIVCFTKAIQCLSGLSERDSALIALFITAGLSWFLFRVISKRIKLKTAKW
jgi:hypothetical protein